MIGIFLGEQNSGKTLVMSYFAYTYYKKGYEIYSNYKLNFKHKFINQELLKKYTENKIQFKKAIFLIDEMYLFLDSRNFGKKTNKIFTYFLLQTSKRNVHLLGTAQYINTIEKRFRENLNFMTFCQRTLKINSKYKEVTNNLRFISDNKNLYIKLNFMIKRLIDGILLSYDIKSFYLKAQPIFKIYDTTQLLDINE